jgi:hypothetical protein
MEDRLKIDIKKTIDLYIDEGKFSIFTEEWINSQILYINSFSTISISKNIIAKELNVLFNKPRNEMYIKQIIEYSIIYIKKSFNIIYIDLNNINLYESKISNILTEVFLKYPIDLFLYFYNLYDILSQCNTKNTDNIEIYLTKDNIFSLQQQDETVFIWNLISNIIALNGNSKIEIIEETNTMNYIRINIVMSIILKNILDEIKDKIIFKLINIDEIILLDEELNKISKFYENIDNQLDNLLNS